ncbi:MAG: hypothetical protein QM791_14820 [Ferruginibacter sp.]
MKRSLITLAIIFSSMFAVAQDAKDESETPRGGFKKDMLFTGGNINIGYFNGVTVLGATPQLGYSITNWLDAGIVLGYTYTSQSIDVGTKYRQNIFGPGAFARVFPIDFLFVSAQFEQNFIKQKYIYPGGSERNSYNVSSLLLGLGYTSGKEGRNSPYYYVSVSVDVMGDARSPYRTFANEIYPVVNAGFNIPLFQGSRRY